MKKLIIKINNTIKKIRLVDRFLILIMIILLMQSAYSLFVYETASPNANSIDIIIRTSAAAIFGYFISSNFSKSGCRKFQIVVISLIGIISLSLLIISRNFAQLTPQTASTVSQLRDFASACVSFLVSSGKKN